MEGKTIYVPVLAMIIATSGQSIAAQHTCAGENTSVDKVMKVERLWLKAISTRNAGLLNKILDSSFEDIAWDGHIRTKDSMLAALRRAKGAGESQRVSNLRIIIHRPVAIVRGINTVSGKGFGTVKLRFTDIFLNRDGEYKAIAAQETLRR